MDYQKLYNKICERAKNRKLEGYKESHHIIPKSSGGSSDGYNLVDLTAREHFLCHRLLCEIYPENKKLVYAYWMMAIGKKRYKHLNPYKVTSRQYESAKAGYIKLAKEKTVTEVHKQIVSSSNSKSVNQYDMEGNLIATYSSCKEAERKLLNKPKAHWKSLPSNIDAACRLKQKSSYGFIWKYEGEVVYLSQHKKLSRKQ
tara:strand:+ start:31 stop:630 length:600 start_codon:yes stop_codon:yes gene_type:complete